MSVPLAFWLEVAVALLLVASIAAGLRLERRLKAFRLNEGEMRATIGDLVAATQRAERAVECLKAAIETCDSALTERLHAAEQHSHDLGRQMRAAHDVMSRISAIVTAGRRERAG